MGRAGSLFTGVGGLDMAVAEVFGTDLAWVCDNDEAARKVLAHRYPGVLNLGDITAVDWGQVERVEWLTGGSPCQDVSAAGKRAGMYPGTRSGLWAHMAYGIKRLRPRYVVFENVRGLGSACAENEMGQCPGCVGDGRPHRPFLRALGRVLGDLADLRYDAVWCGLPASGVGAPHERFRFFVLAIDAAAHTDRVGHQQAGHTRNRWPGPAHRGATAADTPGHGRREGWTPPAGQRRGPDAAQRGRTTVADTTGPRRPQHLTGAALTPHGTSTDIAGQVQPGRLDRAAAHTDRPGLEGRQPTPGHHLPGRSAPADTDSGRQRPHEPDLPAGQPDTAGSHNDWGEYTDAIRRWEQLLGRAAPVPRVDGPRGGLKLNPALCEWMQGFPAGWITDVPGVSLNDCLKLAGNSVNPYQAVAALRWMAAQLSERAA